jgi:hypothetical protein
MRRGLKAHLNPVNCGTLGALGEILVTYDLMLKGYEVYRAISPASSCDLVALREGKAVRVEVTKGMRRGKTQRLIWPRHEASRYDLLAVWESDGSITYDPPLQPVR